MTEPRRGRTRGPLSQQYRLLSALVYLGALVLLARYLTGQFLPPYGLAGLWFYAGAGALLLADFLLEPHFTRPVDSLASGVAVLIAAVTVSLDEAAITQEAAAVGRFVVIVVALLVIVLALTAITFKDSSDPWRTAAATATRFLGLFGKGRWLFSGLLLAAGFAAFADSAERIAALYLTWFAIVGLRPVEGTLALAGSRAQRLKTDGRVEDLIDPLVVGVRLRKGLQTDLGMEVRIRPGQIPGTVVEMSGLSPNPYIRVALAEPTPVVIGSDVEVTNRSSEQPVVGYVAEGTSLEEIVITTVAATSALGLEEGSLVEVDVGGVPTLYQVVAANVAPRSDRDARRQLLQVTARKLGTWNEERTDFAPVSWVPAPGCAVVLRKTEDLPGFDERYVGRVPGTSYGVALDSHQAVTHNTAILGILGIGKTHLAWELMRRMLTEGIKVVALDITGRYSQHFQDVFPPTAEQTVQGGVSEAISGNYGNTLVREGQAGNVQDFEAALWAVLEAFVSGEGSLLILNPNAFAVDRMEGKPYQGHANYLSTLTMVDITRRVAEQLLELAQGLPREPADESASICLVLEEAHSLIPEWNSVAVASDQEAVNGTARALLQGRKYGFGCLLVTQRTANVTKSILNQCNTVFGMRSYDATGMGFLENYIGPRYSGLLATLRDREAVVFGRASSCASPLIIQLNDRDDFLAGYWSSRAAGVPTWESVGPPGGPEVETDPPPF